MRIFLNNAKSTAKHKKSREGVSVRPYAEHFIREMAKYYEIVSYSNHMPTECNNIIGIIDETRVIRHRLYKYHFAEGRRDLSKIGR
jgi:CTD small phosphatase-like protein 2